MVCLTFLFYLRSCVGGIGLVPMIGALHLLVDKLQRYGKTGAFADSSEQHRQSLHRVVLVWAARDIGMMSHFVPELMSISRSLSRVGVSPKLSLHLTAQVANVNDSALTSGEAASAQYLQLLELARATGAPANALALGRPSLGLVCGPTATKVAGVVYACGPHALVADARRVAHTRHFVFVKSLFEW